MATNPSTQSTLTQSLLARAASVLRRPGVVQAPVSQLAARPVLPSLPVAKAPATPVSSVIAPAALKPLALQQTLPIRPSAPVLAPAQAQNAGSQTGALTVTAPSSAPASTNFLELARKRLLGAGLRPTQDSKDQAGARLPVVVANVAPESINPEPVIASESTASDPIAALMEGPQAPVEGAVPDIGAGVAANADASVQDGQGDMPTPERAEPVPVVAQAVMRRALVSPMAGGLARIAKRAQEMKQADPPSAQPATSAAAVPRLKPGSLAGAGSMPRDDASPFAVGALRRGDLAVDNDWGTDPNAMGLDDDDEDDDDGGYSQSSAPAQEEVTGVLNSVRVFNDWAIGSLWTQDREEVRLTGGALSGLTEGLEYKFKGVTKPSKYGEALEISGYEPVISVDPKALERYMVKSFKGVGPVKAQKYITDLMESARGALHVENPNASAAELAAASAAALDVLREKLLHRPWEIDLTSLASQAKLDDGHDPQEAAKQVVLTRNLMLRLGGQKGFKESVAKSLATYLLGEIGKENSSEGSGENPGLLGVDLVEASWTKLVTNPYKPIRKAPGYGFGMAEVVASYVGIPKDSGMRLAALSEYAVEQACQRRGHTFLGAKDFIGAVQKVDPTVDAQKALTFAIAEKVLIAEVATKRLYTPKLHEAEQSLARNIAKLLAPAEPMTSRSAGDIKRKLIKDAEKINPSFKGGLDELQLEAVASMLTSPTRLHVLTGGPGTGKTSIIECAVYLLKKKAFQFTAPTGKAAKVLSSRVASLGYRASTIHSMLRGGIDDGFLVNEDTPLECDVLVVDESTMNGVELADALVRALRNDTHVIFLGDPGRRANGDQPGRAGQLPSISPGRFMMDLLELPGVNHVNLAKTYRNSGGILEVVNEIGDSDLDVRDRDAVHFHGLPAAGVGFAAVKQEYIESVMRDGVENTLLVMPKRQGDKNVPDWNTTYANAVLRDVLNPQGLKLPGTSLATGDRILIRQNLKIEQPSFEEKRGLRLGASLAMPGAALPLGFDPERLTPLSRTQPQRSGDVLDFAALARDAERPSGADTFAEDEFVGKHGPDDEGDVELVVNGDTGTIVGYSMDPNMPRVGTPKWIHLALDDGRLVDLPGEEMACLDYAYALTVHSAQGSEYKNVIMAVTPGSADFMNQNMIFTGFSRAKASLSVYADPRELKKIASVPMPDRNSALVPRILECLTANDLPVDAEVCVDQSNVDI